MLPGKVRRFDSGSIPPEAQLSPVARNAGADRLHYAWTESRVAFVLVLLAVLITFGCGRSLERQTREQVRTLGGAELDSKSVEVVNARESGGRATAEVVIRTAVTLRHENGDWVLDEVRLGDRRWEKVDRIVAAVEAARTEETRAKMEQILEAIGRFRTLRGDLPKVDGLVELIDLLHPNYLDAVIRLDGWQNPFRFEMADDGRFELRSDGPDGKQGTGDDLVVGS